MKIAVLTEGDSEVQSLTYLYGQINKITKNTMLRPLKINVDPLAQPGVIARECKSRLLIAKQTGAGAAVVLLDREKRQECPGQLAEQIQMAIRRVCPILPVSVVFKDRMFENWLVADPDALAQMPARFELTQATRRRIQPDRADSCDAYRLLSSMAIKQDYRKTADGQAICKKMNVLRAAANSRSFRHLLHIVETQPYQRQCKVPVRPSF